MSEDVVALCLIGFQPGFTKIAANATGMYVSMKSGNVKIEKIFLATPAWMFFHSVTVVMPPKTMRSAHALKIVSHIDQSAIVMSPPVAAPMMPYARLQTIDVAVRKNAGMMFMAMSNAAKLPWKVSLVRALP